MISTRISTFPPLKKCKSTGHLKENSYVPLLKSPSFKLKKVGVEKIGVKMTPKLYKGSLPDEEKQSSDQPFRFPAFEVVDIRPDIAPTTALDRLWLRITAPNFNSQVDLKVSQISLVPKLGTE